MKAIFLGVILAIVGIMAVGAFLWMVVHALWTMFVDRQTKKEYAQLEAEAMRRRRERWEENRRRLANGCEHDFEQGFGDFPAGVCSKCGLAREKPDGDCDHVWRRIGGGLSGSRCERCGKSYQAV